MLAEIWFHVIAVAIFCYINVDATVTVPADNTCELSNATFDGSVNGDDILFEGDIKISIETLLHYYDLNEIQENELKSMHQSKQNLSQIRKRAAPADGVIQLWDEKVVYYTIDPSLDGDVANMIEIAINEWELATCLRFIHRTCENNYITFRKGRPNECNSWVGQVGNEQIINLGTGCHTHGIILHEIGHALGLWHEHSRPDRDSYITVNRDNIRTNDQNYDNLYDIAFKKIKDKHIDYQGTDYDYGSIMHYRSTAFVKRNCSDCHTLDVNNNYAYMMQGSPPLGQRIQLSTTDIEQVNRLYSCPNYGERGFLMVYIRYNDGLDLANAESRPYVRVIAVGSSGWEFKRRTTGQNSGDPTWNQWLYFSYHYWQFFRIRIWDENSSPSEPLSMSETVPLLNRGRFSTGRIHCINTTCDRFINYDYKLSIPVYGHLQIYIRYAKNLPNTTEPIMPYVRVTALHYSGSQHIKTTTSKNSSNPTWNEWLDTENDWCWWVAFQVQIWDNNTLRQDENISDPQPIDVFSGYHTSIKHCISNSDCNAHLILDYVMEPDGDECDPNPCLHGGTCIDKCVSYTCSCERPYTGPNCEYIEGSLIVWRISGTGFSADSAVYVEFTAYDIAGNSNEKVTETIRSNANPSWNQVIVYTTDTWSRFKVNVYSDDVIEFFNEYNLPSTSSFANNVTIENPDNAMQYVKFSYFYIV